MSSRFDVEAYPDPTPELTHRMLSELCRRQNQGDFHINAWLAVGFRVGVERVLGMGSFREYVMRLFSIGPRAADDRIRTAMRLAELPVMRKRSRRGELQYCLARELTRVATAETEERWLAASEAKTYREVRRMVSGRTRGDTPTTPKKPEAEVEDVVFRRVAPHARALLGNVRETLVKESGESICDGDLLEEMASAFLSARSTSGDVGRAPHQVSLSVCPRCEAAEWEGGHVATVTDVAVARCDAQELGRVDVSGDALERATQTIPPKTRRAVLMRHRSTCRVPGCTHRAFLHLHHLDARAEGGRHDPERLIPLCGRHHRAVHEGALIVRGRFTEGFVFEHADGTPYGSPHARADQSEVMTKVFGLLTAMDFRESEARRMVDAVRAGPGRSYDVDSVLRAALREASMPAGVREEAAVYRRVA